MERIRVDAVECADTPVWSVSDAEAVQCVKVLHDGMQAMTSAMLHLIRQIDARGVPIALGTPGTAHWLRSHLRVSRLTAGRLHRLATAVDERPSLDRALAGGAVNVEQATEIVKACAALPADVGVEVAAKAEAVMVQWASELDPQQLHALGRRVLHLVDPDAAEAADREAVQRQQASAYASRTLSVVPAGDGRVRVSGWLDVEMAAIVSAALDPLCSPRRRGDPAGSGAGGAARAGAGGPAAAPSTSDAGAAGDVGDTGPGHAWTGDAQHARACGDAQHGHACGDAQHGRAWAGNTGYGRAWAGDTGTGSGETRHGGDGAPDPAVADDRTPGQRRADALVDICRLALNTGQLPDNGGDRPQVTITIPISNLRDDTGLATLDTGERITAAQARRMACDAHLLPIVLGAQGQVLDVGRSRRLFTGALRRALVQRDGGCAFPGCDKPPRWTDGHHIRHWANGGSTSLDNAVLLCGQHHRLIHHSDWQVRLNPDGLPEFIPPAHVDPEQRPRRNQYHRRT